MQTANIAVTGLANPIELNYVLYGETNWAEWRSGLVAASLPQYAAGYDGYTYFVLATFDNLPSQGDNWGLLVDIPSTTDGSSTGFGFFNNGDGTYTGVSVYYDGKS